MRKESAKFGPLKAGGKYKIRSLSLSLPFTHSFKWTFYPILCLVSHPLLSLQNFSQFSPSSFCAKRGKLIKRFTKAGILVNSFTGTKMRLPPSSSSLPLMQLDANPAVCFLSPSSLFKNLILVSFSPFLVHTHTAQHNHSHHLYQKQFIFSPAIHPQSLTSPFLVVTKGKSRGEREAESLRLPFSHFLITRETHFPPPASTIAAANAATERKREPAATRCQREN